jgi:transposase InsO family protein
MRPDDRLESAAKTVRKWLKRLGVATLFVEPGSSWENGCIESFNGKLNDELLNGENSLYVDFQGSHKIGKFLYSPREIFQFRGQMREGDRGQISVLTEQKLSNGAGILFCRS